MPKINTAYTFDVALVSQADTKAFQVNPTLAAGDVKVSIDEGAFANLASLPVVTPAGSRNVKVAMTAGEMNGSRIAVQFVDAAGAEWCELLYEIETSPDDLTVANIRTGLGLASANLDTQLSTIDDFLDTEIAAIKAKTDNLPAAPAAVADIAAALDATIADSIPADGTRPSVRQALYMLTQFMVERSVSSTTCTVKKPDGSTTLFTLTLDSAIAPTSITRAT